MSLSKKNLDKLKKYKKSKILNNDSNITNNYIKIDNKDNSTKNQLQSVDPNKIFYSLINNSDTLDDTLQVNHLLRNSEANEIILNSKKANYSNKLTTEEELYDEFNYLLDE